MQYIVTPCDDYGKWLGPPTYIEHADNPRDAVERMLRWHRERLPEGTKSISVHEDRPNWRFAITETTNVILSVGEELR